MKHIFVVNPAAGRKKHKSEFCREIEQVCLEEGVDWQIYLTTGVGDATRFVRECMETDPGPLRFYACGGDGTFNEVITALVGQHTAEAAMIPMGTGNDFPRSFEHAEYFNDLRRQLRGTALPVDVIAGTEEETGQKLYAVNLLNLGFDSEVARRLPKVKRIPLIKGTAAYVAALAITFFRKLGKQMRITLDEEETLDGSFLLTCAGNGRACGGGFLAAPKASLTDGQMEVGIVRKIGRLTFLKLVGSYRDGSYIEKESAKPYVFYRRVRRMKIEVPEGGYACLDGEIYPVRRLVLEILPTAVSVSLPEGVWEMNTEKEQPVPAGV